MPLRPLHRVKFEIERLILRSPFHRLALIAMAIGAVSFLGGYLVHAWAVGFEDLPDAVWWAFLRLTDPGYLGDDEGTFVRTISTILTVLGYVLFLGALIAIMTQGLNQTIHRLQQGFTPIAEANHFLILGWTNRTATLIEELILSEGRVRRFLRRHGARRLRIVILIEDLNPAVVQDLRDRLGPLWNSRTIIVRSGSPLRLEHLERVDFVHAAAILLPFPEMATETTFARDERTIKILLSVSSAARQKGIEEIPLMVAELIDGRKISLARRAYGGSIEILASDVLISRLMAQNVRHPGLAGVYSELLTHSAGSEIYIRECPALAGRTFGEVTDAFAEAIPLGVLRPVSGEIEPFLLPPRDFALEAHDRFVVIAGSYAASIPSRLSRTPAPLPVVEPRPLPVRRSRRILLLGWNHKVPALLQELSSYRGESFDVDQVSLVPLEERAAHLRRHGIDASVPGVRLVEADFTSVVELTALEPEQYDNVVILASDWMHSEAESDARTILGFLVLDEILTGARGRPEVLVELMDQENVPLLAGRADVLISPLVLSHMLAQVALRRDLRVVFDEMFGPTGVEIFLRDAAEFVTVGESVLWREVARRVEATGEIALGYRRTGSQPVLNPARETEWRAAERDEIVVLTKEA